MVQPVAEVLDVSAFFELAAEVARIKHEAAPRRVERLRHDLEEIKQNDKELWAQLRELLR